MAQACARALSRSLEVWSKRADSAPDDSLLWIAGGYLSSKHRDNPGAGCVLAALGPDAARQGPGVRRAVTEGLRSAIATIARFRRKS